jgi:hypothetical protein
MGGASSEACGREFIMKKLPSYMRVTRGLALANQKNALAVNNFECRWNFGEGHVLERDRAAGSITLVSRFSKSHA